MAAKSNPNGANQFQLDPRQALLWESYINPHSETFGNALQSALKAGYTQAYAEQITNTEWFLGKVRRMNMRKKGEEVLKEILEMDTTNPKLVGEQIVETNDPALLKIKQDTAKFATERLGKEDWASQTQIANPDGTAIGTQLTEEEKLKLDSLLSGV